MLIQQLKEQRKEKQKPTKMLHTKHNSVYMLFEYMHKNHIQRIKVKYIQK